MTHIWRLDVAEGTICDTHVAKHPWYHGSAIARGHQPGADALRWGMRQRRMVDRPSPSSSTPSRSGTTLRPRDLTSRRQARTNSWWYDWRWQWWCDGWRHGAIGSKLLMPPSLRAPGAPWHTAQGHEHRCCRASNTSPSLYVMCEALCGAYGFSIHDAKEVYERFQVVNPFRGFTASV